MTQQSGKAKEISLGPEPKIGHKMPDGKIYAGITAIGNAGGHNH